MQGKFQKRYRNKNKKSFFTVIKRKMRVHVIPVSFFALALLFLIITAFQIKKTYSVYSQVSELEQRLAQLQKGNADLETQIETFSDPDVIDKEARERLNLKKEGENVVVIIPKDSARDAQPKEQAEENKSLWKKFLNLFNFKN